MPVPPSPAPRGGSTPAKWSAIWERLSASERREGVAAWFAALSRYPEARRQNALLLAEALRTREKTVLSWPEAKRIDRFARLSSLPSPITAEIVCAFFVRCRFAIVSRFLDAAGIPHVNGVVEQAQASRPVEKDRLVAGLRAVFREFERREADLYAAACVAQGVAVFAHLEEARKELSALDAAAGPAPGSPAGITAHMAPSLLPSSPEATRIVVHLRGRRVPGPVEGREPVADPYMAERESLTALDRVLVDAILATCEGVSRGEAATRMAEALDELADLSRERRRTPYLLGFLDAVRGPSASDTGTSVPDLALLPDRDRGWYLCGAATVLSRKGDSAGIVALLSRFPEDASRLLGDRHEACEEAALPVLDAYADQGRTATALNWLHGSAVARVGDVLASRLLALAESARSSGRKDEVARIAALLAESARLAKDRRKELGVRVREQITALTRENASEAAPGVAKAPPGTGSTGPVAPSAGDPGSRSDDRGDETGEEARA